MTETPGDPASLSLAPSEGLLSPFSLLRLPARTATEHRPTRTRSVRRPKAVPPRAGCPSTLHQTQHTPGPAGQPAGAAVAPPSEPTAYSHLGASSLKPQRGEGCPRRRAPDAGPRSPLPPEREAGEVTRSRQARARILGRPGRRADLGLTKYNGCQRH